MARLCHCGCSHSWPQGRLGPPWAEMRWPPDAQRAAVRTCGRSVPVEEGVRRDCARADSVKLGPPGGNSGVAIRHTLPYLSSVSRSVMSKSLQFHGLQPSRLLCPWNSPGNNIGVGSHSLSPEDLLDPEIEPKPPTFRADSLPYESLGKPYLHVGLFVTPLTIAHQTPLSVGFPRQEYWSGLP